MKTHTLTKNDSLHYHDLLQKWNITYDSSYTNKLLHGSPERVNYRIVIKDVKNKYYLLEQISSDRYKKKQLICQILDDLYNKKMPYVQRYILSNTNEYLVLYKNNYWQIRPYIPAANLPRPDHLHDAWRGKKSAEFLLNLWEKTARINDSYSLPNFSLSSYVHEMVALMKTYNFREYKKIQSIYSYLSNNFFKQYDNIPLRFCHGDFHPLNIIWSTNNIKSVIDWEFLGMKIELYDIANMIGCIGIEHPSGLTQSYACSFIQRVLDNKFISETSYDCLFDCIISIRFGWLAEWLRKKDNEMINLEITYMHILLKNKDFFIQKWKDL